MTLDYNILDTEHSTKTYDVTATVAMHADGNDTGSSLRSWVLNYVTTSVNILWCFQ